MLHVALYMKEHCRLCDDAEKALHILSKKWEFHIEKINIYDDDDLLELYQLRIPVIKVNDEIVAEGIIDEHRLHEAFETIVKSDR